MKRNKLAYTILMILVMLIVFTSVIGYAEEKPITFTGVWTAGGIGGTWFSLSVTSLESINKSPYIDMNVKVVPGGGIPNPIKLVTGVADIGYVNGGSAMRIFMEKEGPYEGKEYDPSLLRVIAENFLGNEYNLYAAEETGIETIADFVQLIKEKKGLKVTVGGYNMTDIFVLKSILEYYGTTLEDISANGGKLLLADYSQAAGNITDKHADYWFACIAADSASILQASTSRKMIFAEYPDDLAEYLRKMGFNRKILPGNINEKIETEGKVTIEAFTILCANKNVPEEVVYYITKALCENYKDLHIFKGAEGFKPETAGANSCNVPLHPGAVRYYKEMGYPYNPGK